MDRVRARFPFVAIWAGLAASIWAPSQGLSQGDAPFERLYRQAYEIRVRELGADHPDTVKSLVRLGALLRAHGRPGNAEQLLRRALATRRTSEAEDVEVLLELGETLLALGQDREAESYLIRALDRIESGTLGARTLLRIARLREARGDRGGARTAYQSALERFGEGGPLPPDAAEARATALNNLGLLLESEGDLADAEAMYRRSADAHREALGDGHPATAAVLANVAGLLALRGESAAAARLLEQSLAVIGAAYGPDHDDTARLRNRLGEVFETLGRFDEAETQYNAALSARNEPSPERGLVLADLGRLLGVRGDLARAEPALAEAVRQLEAEPSGLDLELAEAVDSYGAVLRAAGRLERAESAIRRALSIRERELGADHPEVALSQVGLAGVLHLRGDLNLARPLYLEALGILEGALGPDHPEVGETLYNLGHLERALGDLAGARAAFGRSVRILSAAYGPGDPFVAEIRDALRAVR